MQYKRKKICFVANIPAAVNSFLRGHINAAAMTYEVVVICAPIDAYLLDGINARIVLLPIVRKPSLFSDLLVLFNLYVFFCQEHFDIVHTHFPKPGLLGMLSAWLCGVPIRIHTFHGEVWANRTGWRRKLLKLFDKLVQFLATEILLVSFSQRDFLVSEGVLTLERGKVIRFGSVCGVDNMRFHPNQKLKYEVRQSLGIEVDARVILFVGRLNQDKGMLDLSLAFNAVARRYPDTVLLLVGSEEDVTFSRIREICCVADNRLHYVSFTAYPERYMSAADIFCLPSYREGFNTTIIEAAACGLPTVASRIYGITDAVVDGETGLLFSAGDVDGLIQSLLKLLEYSDFRQQIGEAARVRALEFFSSENITREIIMLYNSLADKH
jgi:glycosyltransferase involved in cell wall biosynthesis